ncbi:MAG TPA: OmpA family protein [Candidatus Dormibacteraeota bacterium]|nr:OmpA family protein [Candidatus Dormibacteraeota bacterium]
MKRALTFFVPLALTWACSAMAQTADQSPAQNRENRRQSVYLDTSGKVPVYKVTVVGRTTKAVNYRHRSGPTEIAFRGTALMPEAKGQATVNSKQGRIEIKAHMEKLSSATQFGPEYLTYVLWAVTPEGRPKNLGEVLLNGTSSKMEVTTDLQTFGLIVTAEPYFAVTQPSDVVIMENFVTNETSGTSQPIDAQYELLQRGQYLLNVPETDRRPIGLDKKTPLELYEARNAVRIARWTGADRYAAEILQKAEISLQNAEDEQRGKVGKKTVAQNSREAAQMAEDARLIAVRRMEEERLANERMASQNREAAAQSQAAQAQAQASQAESEKAAAQRAKAEAEQAKAEAERAKAEAQSAAERAAKEKTEAEAETAKARQSAAQAEQEKAQLREQLRQQLNLVLETRETARGLIVNMSDVLFDTGKYTLKPGAREKLAKISGIIIAHPGLKLEIEGHTDSVGGDEFNQRLSEQRANTVREYLLTQGVKGDAVTSRGFGKARPVASNDTVAGRQMNRRVELVVSGDVIGAAAGQDK